MAEPVGSGGTVGMPFLVGVGVPEPGMFDDTGLRGYGVTNGDSDWFATGVVGVTGDDESLYM